MISLMMKFRMRDMRSMSPAFFLALLLHAVILFFLLVTIAYQTHQHIRRRMPQPVSLRQQQIPQPSPRTPQSPPTTTIPSSDQKTVAALQPTEHTQASKTLEKVAENITIPTEAMPQQYEITSQKKRELQQKNAAHAAPPEQTELQPQTASYQQTQSSQRRPHAWRKHHPAHTTSATDAPSHAPSPTLSQLLNAGVESIKHMVEQEYAPGEKSAITKSFEKDAYAAYIQEILYAIRFALNRQRIKVAPINTPSRIECAIMLNQDGRITASKLISAHVTNNAMQHYVDEVIAATRFAGPVRPFPSCITAKTLPLTIFIVNDQLEHDPHLMNTPRIITFRIYNPRS